MSNNSDQIPTSASECHVNSETGQKSQHESTGNHAPSSEAMAVDIYTCSAESSITATMGTDTIDTARVNQAGIEPQQPGKGMTKYERDDLLRGVGSQFDSVSGLVHSGTRSSPGPGNR